MARAFLSHSSSDNNLVHKIASQLGNRNCVLDEFSFELGGKTLDEIFKGMDESDVFVLFISDKALDSKWVQREIGMAHSGLKSDCLDRILPIIIDSKVSINDNRIPRWLVRDYNIKTITNEVLIYGKIKKALREVNFKFSSHNQEIEDIFVGRNEEMAKFERDINNLDGWTPTYIIAYNFYSGIGRRTFLKNALVKCGQISKQSSCQLISLDRQESIESFIYKLNTISENDDVFKADLTKLQMSEKIEMAVALVKDFLNNKEIIFIEDNGGIVLPNKQISNWFEEIVCREEFKNNLVFCIISKFRPNEQTLLKENRSLTYMIPELKPEESRSLFVKLLRIYGLDTSVSKDDKQFFVDRLKGIPAQIFFAVKMIDINLYEAKKGIREIEEFADQFSKILMEKLASDEIANQVAILLSKNEVFSLTLINKVFGDNEKTESAIQLLLDLSLITFMFGNYEYLSLNKTLADYIRRSKLNLSTNYQNKLSEEIKRFLKKGLDSALLSDYSGFMLTLQSMLREGRKIPSKYFMPSLLLKQIIMLYDQGDNRKVVEICDKLLEMTNYDSQMLWETRYWQTAALAKMKNPRALDNMIYFKEDSIASNFLKGFYYRNIGDKQKALDFYYRVLRIDKSHQRSKREIVNILLSQQKYSDALDMARENYISQKTNIFHIHSYFICLIRRHEYLMPEDIRTLKSLIESMKGSMSTKAADMLRCMEGEYEYYVNGDINKAKEILLYAVDCNENKKYPIRSLREIYKKAKRWHEYGGLGLDNIYVEDDSVMDF